MHGSDDFSAFEERLIVQVTDDVFGIARYLAESVSDGEITADDAASALAEWANKNVLTHVAAHLCADSETEHLVQEATRRAA